VERPKPDPPLDITSFLDLVDEKLYPCKSGGINAAGTSRTAVLLVFGPDAEEGAAVNDRLQAALLDHLRWQQTDGPPTDTDST
jgi:hypothetical protein